jgi:iron complex outermembrane receptor protein
VKGSNALSGPCPRSVRIPPAYLCLCLLAARPAAAQPCAATIDVHVVDALAHDPVADAFVTVNQEPGGNTDRHGRLKLTGLCAGRLVIDVVHAAFEPAHREVSLAGAASVELALTPLVETVTVVEAAAPTVDARSTTAVTGEALARKRGQSLSETVAEVPGVTQLRSGSGLAKPIVRGHFGRRLPILVDGVRHRSQDWGLDHTPEIDPAMADRITVVRGASGVRYGSDAIGGVLLVDPPALPDRPGFAGETHLVGSSNGLGGSLMTRAQFVPAAVPALSLQLEGGVKRVRAPVTPDYPLDNAGEGEWTAGLTAAYRVGSATYQLSFRHFQAELGVCTCYRVESAADFLEQARQQRPIGAELYTSEFAIARPFQAVAHELAVARGRWSPGSLGKLTATYALQYDDRREYDVVRQATTGPQFAFRLWTHDAELALEHTPIHLSDHHHLVGSLGATGMVQRHGYGGLPLVPDHLAGAGGVHASERLLGHDYDLEAGVRYDFLARRASIARNDFLRLVRSGQLAAAACGVLLEGTDPVTCESSFHTLSASIGAVLRLGNAWMTKLDLSTASRPPNPDEQYLNGTAPSFPVFALGRPDVGPETSYTASITASHAGDRLDGELSAFANYISDYIYFAPAIGPDGLPVFDVLIRGAFPRFVTRPVDALFWGADGQVNASPLPWLELAGQASAVRARNITDRTYLVFVPPDRVRGSLAVTRKALLGLRRIRASVAGTYAARQTRFDLAADLAPPPASHFLAEAALEAETRVAGQTITVALQGTNLLGQRYREYTSLLRYFADQPGRQLLLRISLSYGSNQPQP